MIPEAYDVVIIGAGPSGIGAAVVLAKYSLKVLLVDENNQSTLRTFNHPVFFRVILCTHIIDHIIKHRSISPLLTNIQVCLPSR